MIEIKEPILESIIAMAINRSRENDGEYVMFEYEGYELLVNEDDDPTKIVTEWREHRDKHAKLLRNVVLEHPHE